MLTQSIKSLYTSAAIVGDGEKNAKSIRYELDERAMRSDVGRMENWSN